MRIIGVIKLNVYIDQVDIRVKQVGVITVLV